MINIGKIKKTFNGQIVLDIEKLSLIENKKYVVIGPNGSGKSTFAKILAGLLIDDSGKVKKLKIDDDSKELSVAYLPQKPFVFDMSLERNLLINGFDKKKCMDLIHKFDIDYLKSKNAKKFSGGELQKMGLARFMMKDYDVVILDEPTSAMDEISKSKTMDIIKDYVNAKTLIMITHDLSKLNSVVDTIIKIDCGKIL